MTGTPSPASIPTGPWTQAVQEATQEQPSLGMRPLTPGVCGRLGSQPLTSYGRPSAEGIRRLTGPGPLR